MLTIRLKYLLLMMPILIVGTALSSVGALDSPLGIVGAFAAMALYITYTSDKLMRPQQTLLRAAQRLVPESQAAGRGNRPAQIAASLEAAAQRLQTSEQRIRDLEAKLSRAEAEAQRAGKAKRAFLANIGHELRTPMNVIIGMTRLSMRISQSPQQRDYLERVDRAAHTLLNQISNILDYVKLDAGDLHIDAVAFNLDDILETVVGLARLKIGNKDIHLALERDEQIPNTLVGDPQRLTQVLGNLADNSVKFTKRGTVTIGCALARSDEGSVQVRFEVRDSGIGVDPTHLGELISPFAQGDESMTRRYGGIGLGLSICGTLVQAMGGELRADSAPGQGSTFAFVLAFAAADGGARAQSPNAAERRAPDEERRRSPMPAPQLDLSGTRVRLHGDERLLRRVLRRFHQDYESFVPDYRDLRSAHNRFAASQLARALSSAAGNLGAIELKEAADRLAKKRRGEDDPSDDMYLVARLMRDVLAEIETRLASPDELCAQKASAGEDDTAPLSDADLGGGRAELYRELQELSALLSDFDAAAINRFQAFRASLTGLVSQDLIDELQCAVNGFDFCLAYEKLRRVAAEIGTDLPQLG
ncbi:MAG: hypothetical protein K9L70_00520 [Thiohalocapsa sp.]|nr:hypothetical protein [Thiohalocapsa sp.]MCF7990095.1 hypothetical protein [Thiohalocapsa sp.]